MKKLLLSLLLLITTVTAKAQPYDLSIFIGQSNMTGRVTEQLATPLNQNVLGWDGHLQTYRISPSTLNDAVFRRQYDFTYPVHIQKYTGPEVACTNRIQKITNRQQRFAKYAWGGSAISTWNPTTGVHYKQFMKHIEGLKTDSNTKSVTIYWMQGESDTTPSLSYDYIKNLLDIKKALTTKFGDIRFIVGRITREPWITYTGTDTGVKEVRTALESFEWVDTDTFTKVQEPEDNNNPPAHYDTQGTEDLGIAFANQFLYTPVPRHRLYGNGHHYYTSSNMEKKRLMREGWVLEDKQYAYKLPSENKDTTPYFRAYNTVSGEHFWTANIDEYRVLINIGEWVRDGIDGHIFKTPLDGTVPLRRYLSIVTGLHHWSNNADEHNRITANGWVFEQIDGYVLP